MKRIKCLLCLSLLSGLSAFIGCSQDAVTTTPATTAPKPALDGTKYLLVTEPAGATGVTNVRQDAKDKDSVVIVGRIGGSENPWVAGLAAFSIVDPSLKSCIDVGCDECDKPWDFC